MKVVAIRPILLAAVIAVIFTAPVMAQQLPTSGLGSAWPTDTQDVSQAQGFHAYVWLKAGVKYVQINDTAGNVLIAVAESNGSILPIPMGKEVQYLQTSSTQAGTPSSGIVVYQDDMVTITATPQGNGTTQFQAAGTCTDPTQCSTHPSGGH